MTITASATVGEVARNLPQAVRLFEKLGIDYCCGGGRTLESACTEKGLPIETVTAALETLRDVAGPAEIGRPWASEPLQALIRHIVETHHQVVRRELPRLSALIGKMSEVHGPKRPEFARVRHHVESLADELLSHLGKEEKILFPYIEQLEDATQRGGAFPRGCFPTVAAPVEAMEMEHQTAGNLLAAIRSEIEDRSGCPTCQEFFRTFDAFATDLHQHIHLENNILFPRAIELEAKSFGGPEA